MWWMVQVSAQPPYQVSSFGECLEELFLFVAICQPVILENGEGADSLSRRIQNGPHIHTEYITNTNTSWKLQDTYWILPSRGRDHFLFSGC